MELVKSCSREELNLDQACVDLKCQSSTPNLWLYTLSTDCQLCPYQREMRLYDSKNISIKINTAVSMVWRIIKTSKNEKYISASDKNGLSCQVAPKMGQYGIYEFEINSNDACNFRTIQESLNENTALIKALGLVLLLLLCLLVLKVIKNLINTRRDTETNREAETNSGVKNLESKRRIRSIDTVRGMSILLMIFVNNGAGGYPYLEHATWDGLYVGDLVFPCFMWIMGVCIPLSISSQLSRGTSRLTVCRAIVKRSFNLFLIGICLNSVGGRIQLEKIRIFGVFQRLSVAYFATGISYTILFRCIKTKGESNRNSLADIRVLWPQWIVALFVLGFHCAVSFWFPVPGCPKGYLGPGGRHADGKYLKCAGGAAGYMDKVLLGVNHIYQFPTANSVYGSGPFDPEGILGCLTSVFQVFLGIQTGQILREFKESSSRLLRWLSWAAVLCILGLALHFTQIIPVNKNLWSISFVMVTTSVSLVCLCVCYILVDVIQCWDGGPFRIPGMNALLMYVGHQILSKSLPFRWKIGRMNTHEWLLAENLWCVGLWTATAYILHRKRKYFSL